MAFGGSTKKPCILSAFTAHPPCLLSYLYMMERDRKILLFLFSYIKKRGKVSLYVMR